MLGFPTVWGENTADSLLDTAIKYCVKNPRAFCHYNPRESGFELRGDLVLPEEICERILTACKAKSEEINFNVLINIFKDTSRTRLQRINLSKSAINDKGLDILCNHKITELNISGCKHLTRGALKSIAKLWDRLQSLNLGSGTRLFNDEHDNNPATVMDDDEDQEHLLHHCMGLLCANVEDTVSLERIEQSDIPLHRLDLPKLRKLIVHDVANPGYNPCFMSLMRSAQYLTHLDLTKCDIQGDLDGLLVTKQLISLVLCDVPNVREIAHKLCQIKTLRHLDISNTDDHILIYENPNLVLKSIVTSLEDLVSLDISGTNLAGGRTQERHAKENDIVADKETLSDIPGLASRVNRPLEFLGLLNCAHDACYRHHIPAKKIAGDANEEQILTAGQVYCSRVHMIQKVLNDLFQLFRMSSCFNTKLSLDIVMEAMKQHLNVKHVQVSASASLFYIVKGEHKDLFNISMRRKIIRRLIDAMFSHYSDVTMLRNGCLTLIHFKIPDDVFFDYERLASLLLLIVPQDEQDEFVQRIGVYLLNSLACQVDGIEKKMVGDRGAINIMLQLIEKRLLRNLCDEVMETAWSTMWNVTDETPINCARFLENNGMELFLRCLEAFPQKPELLRNMMGLLGNVAEVKELRGHLMKNEYLIVFSELLHSKSDGIEVSYNAAGILSHIASDGPEPWATHHISAVKRMDVLQQMVDAIEKWNLNTNRNINYRSFKPILRLLSVEDTHEAQHWAVWALANLTTVYPEKYCKLLQEEGGIELLEKIQARPNYGRIRELACITIHNCFKYASRNEDSFENKDENDLDIT